MKGAKKTLKKNKVKLILIEINDKKSTFYKKEKNITKMFNSNNYHLIKKHSNHSVSFFSDARSGDYLFLCNAN